ncbi:hypothetical protein GALMADRAFT_147353 [Galerina marginata CBS 339.88]|uniref:Uncharacterized protein n=1 Tax=Galerina marginata (strain CBS 339.88) TaxID=685588 RepID=A0A067SK49_GALM3|nr:hypothetical protein GALMADRAFT_147353 [Galerina marginata CBS 339.88]
MNHTKGFSGGAGADDNSSDDDSAFEGKQPDGYAPTLDDSGYGSGSDDGGIRGPDGLEVELQDGGRAAAGARDHTDKFSSSEGECINQNSNIDEGDLDAHDGLDDDGACSEGQADYTNDDKIAAEPPTEGDGENAVDNGEGREGDELVGDVTAPDFDQEEDQDDGGDSCSKDRGADSEDPNVNKTPAESSSTPNSEDEIHRLRQALENKQKTTARLRAELKAQAKHHITFLASLSLPTSIIRREELHLQTDQQADTEKLQAALHALQDVVDREVEVCLCGGGEYAIGTVELERNWNGKRGRRLSEEDGSQEEDGVDDLGERLGSENFSGEEHPRSRFKRARIE